jgi:DNA-binding LytR/AlgR family response regulator
MTMLRAMICDDEPLATDRLGDMLLRCEGVELAGTALSGMELLQEVARIAPDVIFLDIEMPRLDGFDIVETLSKMSWHAASGPPLIIFVTAHPEMAANAFDSGALDFISKPVRLTRLERAVARARAAHEQREAGRRLEELSAQLDALRALQDDDGSEDHLWLQRQSETVRVAVHEIDWVAAEGDYVRIHAGALSYLERGALAAFEKRLAPHGFVRVHRSWIVNPASVTMLARTRWRSIELGLRCGTRLRVGRNYQAAARALAKSPADVV